MDQVTETKTLITTYKDVAIFVDTDGKFSATPFGKRKAREADTIFEIKREIREADVQRHVRKDVNEGFRIYNPRTCKVETATYIGIRMRDSAKFEAGHNFKIGGDNRSPDYVQVVSNGASSTDIQSLETAARVLRRAQETFDRKLKALTEHVRVPYYSDYNMTPAKATESQNKTVELLRAKAKKAIDRDALAGNKD